MSKKEFDIRCLNQVKSIVLKHAPENYQIFLFGSWAVGQNKQSSDIDIGFEGSQKVNPNVFSKILNEVEETDIPYKVDLVDFFNKEPSFKKLAKKKILLWKN